MNSAWGPSAPPAPLPAEYGSGRDGIPRGIHLTAWISTDILGPMIKRRPNRKRPAVLVRFYPTDLQLLNQFCADACTPRENLIRRIVLTFLAETPRPGHPALNTLIPGNRLTRARRKR